MPSQEKKEKVKEIKKWFEKSESLLVLHYRGLTVTEANDLREQVKGFDSELKVVKNTLTRIALTETPREELVPLFEGPVAVVFVKDDPAPVARAMREFSRGRQDFYMLGGLIEGRVLDGKQVEAFSLLPPRDMLLAQAIGRVSAPLSAMVGVVAGPIRKMLGVFQAIAAKAPAAPAEPEAPQKAVAEEAELNADTAVAEQPQQAEDEQAELNAVETAESPSGDKAEEDTTDKETNQER